MDNKKYCVSFRTGSYDIINNFKGWYIELTSNIRGYSTTQDDYSRKQVFDTLQDAINSVRELRTGEKAYMTIGF